MKFYIISNNRICTFCGWKIIVTNLNRKAKKFRENEKFLIRKTVKDLSLPFNVLSLGGKQQEGYFVSLI